MASFSGDSYDRRHNQLFDRPFYFLNFEYPHLGYEAKALSGFLFGCS
jgi:hypothetical protein